MQKRESSSRLTSSRTRFRKKYLMSWHLNARSEDNHKHLIVAATGTGKTMIAAFDYARICRGLGERPTLLFVAHREEILRQALATFRGVLRDQKLCVNYWSAEPHRKTKSTCFAPSKATTLVDCMVARWMRLNTSSSTNSIMQRQPDTSDCWNI